MGGIFFGDELAQDSNIAGDLGILRAVDEIADLRRELLTVSVDPTVSLLQCNERPRKVEVDEMVTLFMKVDAL